MLRRREGLGENMSYCFRPETYDSGRYIQQEHLEAVHRHVAANLPTPETAVWALGHRENNRGFNYRKRLDLQHIP